MAECCQADSIDGSLRSRFPDLQAQQPLKYGQLFRCQRCSAYWFLPDDPCRFYRLRAELMPALDRWNSTALTLNPALESVLAEIGEVENPYWQTIEIPCVITTRDGKTHQRALVRRSKMPPDRFVWQNLLWPEQVISIAPSPLSLPLEVRRDSFRRREVSMDFAPLPLVDAAGKVYTLSGPGHFLEGQDFQGHEMRPSAHGPGFWGWPNVVHPSPPDGYLYLD